MCPPTSCISVDLPRPSALRKLSSRSPRFVQIAYTPNRLLANAKRHLDKNLSVRCRIRRALISMFACYCAWHRLAKMISVHMATNHGRVLARTQQECVRCSMHAAAHCMSDPNHQFLRNYDSLPQTTLNRSEGHVLSNGFMGPRTSRGFLSVSHSVSASQRQLCVGAHTAMRGFEWDLVLTSSF